MRHRSSLVLVACLLLGVAACGNDTTTSRATDPAPTGGVRISSPAASPSPSTTAPPSATPRPHYRPEDYDFTLVVSCFCADAGVPIRVRVRGGAVTAATYLADGRGVAMGEDATGSAVTIDHVIDAANDPSAHTVEVVWPPGQEYPTSVSVDPSKDLADDGTGWSISDVAPVAS